MKRIIPFLLLAFPAIAAGQPDSGKASAAAATTATPTTTAPPPATTPAPAAPTAAKKHEPVPAGLDDAAGDWNANPCDDFFKYTCGNWIAKTEIPADRSSYSRGFVMIAEQNELKLKDILERAAAGKLKKD